MHARLPSDVPFRSHRTRAISLNHVRLPEKSLADIQPEELGCVLVHLFQFQVVVVDLAAVAVVRGALLGVRNGNARADFRPYLSRKLRIEQHDFSDAQHDLPRAIPLTLVFEVNANQLIVSKERLHLLLVLVLVNLNERHERRNISAPRRLSLDIDRLAGSFSQHHVLDRLEGRGAPDGEYIRLLSQERRVRVEHGPSPARPTLHRHLVKVFHDLPTRIVPIEGREPSYSTVVVVWCNCPCCGVGEEGA
mmetsp:Transcript_21617/g.45296  ORF Transcript_21617/g.45296 Transcript_21617/m.45296 type:complete len:249 (-) Transcript_21617:664-1410(-)